MSFFEKLFSYIRHSKKVVPAEVVKPLDSKEDQDTEIFKTMHVDVQDVKPYYIINTGNEIQIYHDIDKMPPEIRKKCVSQEKDNKKIIVLKDGHRVTYDQISHIPADILKQLNLPEK